MKTKFFRKNTSVKAGALVRRLLRLRLAMTALLLWPVVLSAQNGITVSNLVMDAGTVTFNVSWKNTGMPAIWSDTVWVFVDYNDAGKMRRLPLTPGATLTTSSTPDAGKVIGVDGNDKGVWVVGNARTNGSFSATVQLLTATATATAACVYAINYPPVGKYTASDKIKFTGTPPFELKFDNGSSYSLSRDEAQGVFTIPAGNTLVSFTDASGAPGVINCKLPATYTLGASAPGFCDGQSAVTFTLDNTENGVVYQLYRDDEPVGDPLSGTGSSGTFGAFAVAGTYTAQSGWAQQGYCAFLMNGSHVVAKYALPAKPNLSVSAATVCQGTDVTFWGDNRAANATYTWTASAGTVNSTNSSSFTVSATADGPVTVSVVSGIAYGTARCTSTAATHTAAVIATPPIPATPTNNGPTNVGTAITFNAILPEGADGLQWKGSVTGEGTTQKTTATTAGTYSAAVRSYRSCLGTTLYSEYSGTSIGVIGSGGAAEMNCGAGKVACKSGCTARQTPVCTHLAGCAFVGTCNDGVSYRVIESGHAECTGTGWDSAHGQWNTGASCCSGFTYKENGYVPEINWCLCINY